MQVYRNFINNEFVAPTSACQTLGVLNPRNGQTFAQVSAVSSTLVRPAVVSAAKAQKQWALLPSWERAQCLHKLATLLEEQQSSLASLLALESGKSLAMACAEVHYSAQITRYHAEWARRIEGEVLPSDNVKESLWLQRLPIGVVACLIPFNYPLYILLRKIAPALITGNAVVVRPSVQTPCATLALAKLLVDAEFPPGLVQILVMDHPTAGLLCQQPEVGMITLTGSVAAGRQVLEYAKANIAKVSLELGGKTPAIILPDADWQRAIREIVRSATTHCGQLCTAVTRVYVHASLYPVFVPALRAALLARAYGMSAEDGAACDHDAMGPLTSAQARHRVQAQVEAAVKAGATLECGGFIPEGPGYYYPPTLLSGCRQDSPLVQEELFAPVLAVLPFDSEDEALALANDHQFGLAAVLYTESYRSALRFAHSIEAGELYVNRSPGEPYQGYHAGHKRSGLGGDDGKHGMLEFTQTRLVAMAY